MWLESACWVKNSRSAARVKFISSVTTKKYSKLRRFMGNEQAMQNNGIVIACGMAKREGDEKVAPVFERADHTMYENKAMLKARK